jgi:hypothetical protein
MCRFRLILLVRRLRNNDAGPNQYSEKKGKYNIGTNIQSFAPHSNKQENENNVQDPQRQ